MAELGTARQFKTISIPSAFQPQLQWRFRFGYFSDLAKIVQAAVSPCKSRTAVRTDENDGRAGFELDRTAAGWAICLKDAQLSPPAI